MDSTNGRHSASSAPVARVLYALDARKSSSETCYRRPMSNPLLYAARHLGGTHEEPSYPHINAENRQFLSGTPSQVAQAAAGTSSSTAMLASYSHARHCRRWAAAAASALPVERRRPRCLQVVEIASHHGDHFVSGGIQKAASSKLLTDPGLHPGSPRQDPATSMQSKRCGMPRRSRCRAPPVPMRSTTRRRIHILS